MQLSPCAQMSEAEAMQMNIISMSKQWCIRYVNVVHQSTTTSHDRPTVVVHLRNSLADKVGRFLYGINYQLGTPSDGMTVEAETEVIDVIPEDSSTRTQRNSNIHHMTNMQA